MTRPDARAERTEPDDGSDVGAAFDPREPLMPRAARAERTEPATGEDVEVVRAEVAYILSAWWVSEGEESPEQLAGRILAALDKPGWERALRIEWMKAVIQGRDDEIDNLAAERDAALANVTSAEFCPFDCDHCHDEDCPCTRAGCAGYKEEK